MIPLISLYRYDLNTDQKSFEAVKVISNEVGPFFQAQNDYLDVFDGQRFLNKPGHDIQNGQFSWLATMAMELGTEQQKDIMRKYYGKNGKIENENKSFSYRSFAPIFTLFIHS